MDLTLKNMEEMVTKRNSWIHMKKEKIANPYANQKIQDSIPVVKAVHYIDLMTDVEQAEKFSLMMGNNKDDHRKFAKHNHILEAGVDVDDPMIRAWKNMRQSQGLSFIYQKTEEDKHMLVMMKGSTLVNASTYDSLDDMISKSLQDISKHRKTASVKEELEQSVGDSPKKTTTAQVGKQFTR